MRFELKPRGKDAFEATLISATPDGDFVKLVFLDVYGRWIITEQSAERYGELAVAMKPVEVKP